MAETESRDVTLDDNLGGAIVTVTFGDARVGGYRLYLWNPDRDNPNQFGFGEKASLIPDTHPIGLLIVHR